MRELRKDKTPEQKLGWYHRHWKGMSLDPAVEPTNRTLDWDTQCKADWRVNGELQEQKLKAR